MHLCFFWPVSRKNTCSFCQGFPGHKKVTKLKCRSLFLNVSFRSPSLRLWLVNKIKCELWEHKQCVVCPCSVSDELCEVTNQLLSWPLVIVFHFPSNTETSRDNSFAFQDLKTNRCGFYFVHFDLKEQGWMQEIFIRCSRNVNVDKYKYPANCSSWCHIAIWSNLSLSRQLNTQSAVACTIASLFIMGGQEIQVLLTSQCSYLR